MNEKTIGLLEQYFDKDSRRQFLSIAAKAFGAGAVGVTAIAQSTTGTGTGTTGTGTTSAATTANDIAVLNFALTLEFLEATFYSVFLGNGAIPSGQTSLTGLIGTVNGSPRAFTAADITGSSIFTGLPTAFGTGIFGLLQQIRDHETTHVAVLKQTIQSLGGTPVQPCSYNFPVTSIGDFLAVADALENTGVSAYDGAINMISSPALIQAGATIATVEARHAAFLNLVSGGGLLTGNFTPSATPNPSAPPGVSSNPFPNAFDVPLTMSQVLAIAGPFLGSCPVTLGATSLILGLTPQASATTPFSASSVTLDLSGSRSGSGQALQYSFSIPSNVNAFCPAGTLGTTTTSSTGVANTTGATCPQKAAILVQPNSSSAIIQFVNGPGFYPLQITAYDPGTKQTSTQVILLAYQASGATTLPAGTPGLTMLMSTSGGTGTTSGGI